MISLDTETTGLRWYLEKIIGISIADNKSAKYITVDKLIPYKIQFLIGHNKVVLQNAKFDFHFIMNEGFEIPKDFEDTMLASKVIDENQSHHLEDLAIKYCNAPYWKKELQEYMKANKCEHKDVPIGIMNKYAAGDAYWTLKLWKKLEALLKLDPDMMRTYEREKKVLPIVLGMERRGMLIDRKYLEQLNKKLEINLQKLEKEICKIAGYNFNLRSGKEMGEFLYRKLKLPILKQGKSGAASVDEYTLKQLKHPVIKKILSYRLDTKLKTTYTEGLLTILPKDNVLHCKLNQMGAETGRFSCSDPNLQQVPRENGIRNAFICRPGYTLFFFDFSQVEMRLCAHYSGDKYMIDSLLAGKDLHLSMAAKFYNIPEKKVTKQQRKKIKQLNFGILYGIGADGLALKFEITKSDAMRILNDYYGTYPMLRAFRNDVINKIRGRGWVMNHYGRKRHISPQDAYIGPNSLIQGCAADLFKEAMIKVSECLKGKKSQPLLAIHDELVIEVHNSEFKLIPEIKKAMENLNDFAVPMLVEVEYSTTNWGEKKSWEGK